MVVPCMPLVPASHCYNRSLALLGYGSLTSAWIVAIVCLSTYTMLEVQAGRGTVGECNEGQPTRSRV